jgi:hypothetical protein
MTAPSAWSNTVDGQRQCWHCDRIEGDCWRYPHPPSPWLCPLCEANAQVSGHFITELAEEAARALMEQDWHTDQRGVRTLRAIRTLVWMESDEGRQWMDFALERRPKQKRRANV